MYLLLTVVPYRGMLCWCWVYVLQERERKERERAVRAKVAACAFARGYLGGIVKNVFQQLQDTGYFYDPVEREVRGSTDGSACVGRSRTAHGACKHGACGEHAAVLWRPAGAPVVRPAPKQAHSLCVLRGGRMGSTPTSFVPLCGILLPTDGSLTEALSSVANPVLLLQVEVEFLPWLTQQALVHIEQEALARAVLQQVVADAVAAQVGPSTLGLHDVCSMYPLCLCMAAVAGVLLGSCS